MSAGAENCGHGAENAYMNSDKIGILDKDTDRSRFTGNLVQNAFNKNDKTVLSTLVTDV